MIEALVAMAQAHHTLLEQKQALVNQAVELDQKAASVAGELMEYLDVPDELYEQIGCQIPDDSIRSLAESRFEAGNHR